MADARKVPCRHQTASIEAWRAIELLFAQRWIGTQNVVVVAMPIRV